MAKELPVVETVEAERKPVLSYTITRFDDGTVDVLDNSTAFEGVEVISNQDIYEDIESVAKLVEQKKQFNLAYSASHQYYQDLLKAQNEARAKAAPAPAVEVAPPVVK